VEIYLPKKAVYQGALYETLTEGFNLNSVRQHFLTQEANVKRFLKNYVEGRGYSRADVKNLSPSYEGYSLYELDGVFCDRFSDPLLKLTTNGRDYRLIEERVQVVRLMFLAPIRDFALPHARWPVFAARRFLRFWTHDLEEYKADLVGTSRRRSPHRKASSIAAERRLVDGLKGWLDNIGLFVHGYILYKLCERVHELDKARAIEAPEQEIWVSSFRCLAVVRTTRDKSEGVAQQ
jgi:hypothetical protein